MGENRACVVPGGEPHMRQASIPKLSQLSTAGRAELLAFWSSTIGEPPAAFRTSRELLASAMTWQLQERKFNGLTAAHQTPAARLGPRPSAHEALAAFTRGIDKSSPRQCDHQTVAGSAARGDGAGRRLSTPGPGLWQPLSSSPGDHRHALERPGLLRPAQAAGRAAEVGQ